MIVGGGSSSGWTMASGGTTLGTASTQVLMGTATGSGGAASGGAAPSNATTYVASDEQSQVRALAAQIGATIEDMIKQLQRKQQYEPITKQKKEDGVLEEEVRVLVNKERAKAGLGALSYDGKLDAAAESHNDHQRVVGVMAHEGIGDGSPGSRARLMGHDKAWGENVAVGQRTAQQVVSEWMASPTHRANIMDANFTKLGVAYATGSDGRSYWAQSFGA